MAEIVIERISRTYTGGKTPAVDDISLTVRDREFMVLLFSLVIVSLLYGVLSEFRLTGIAELGTVEQFLTLALFFVVQQFQEFIIRIEETTRYCV